MNCSRHSCQKCCLTHHFEKLRMSWFLGQSACPDSKTCERVDVSGYWDALEWMDRKGNQSQPPIGFPEPELP
jgi:hypothetical protein